MSDQNARFGGLNTTAAEKIANEPGEMMARALSSQGRDDD